MDSQRIEGGQTVIRVFTYAIAVLAIAGVAQAGAADAIFKPLTSSPGDAARGKTIVISREGGHCILCHHLPADEVKVFGNVAPALDGVGSRLTVAQLRQRVVDITAVNPQAVMPAFHRSRGLQRVAGEYRDQPVLNAQQVEDVVAYLATLKATPKATPKN